MISSVREGEMRAKHGEDCQECSRRDCRPCQQPVETALDRRRRTDQAGYHVHSRRADRVRSRIPIPFSSCDAKEALVTF